MTLFWVYVTCHMGGSSLIRANISSRLNPYPQLVSQVHARNPLSPVIRIMIFRTAGREWSAVWFFWPRYKVPVQFLVVRIFIPFEQPGFEQTVRRVLDWDNGRKYRKWNFIVFKVYSLNGFWGTLSLTLTLVNLCSIKILVEFRFPDPIW